MIQQATIEMLHEDPAIILNFYFDAMIARHTSEELKTRAVPRMPGSKQFIYKSELWTIIDTWHTSPHKGYLGGATHIYLDGDLVWMMQYFGYCPKMLAPFLYEAIAREFQKRRFNGGRGPKHLIFKKEGLIYQNIAGERKFEYFHGVETLRPALQAPNAENSSTYRYQGGLMI